MLPKNGESVADGLVVSTPYRQLLAGRLFTGQPVQVISEMNIKAKMSTETADMNHFSTSNIRKSGRLYPPEEKD